MSDPDRYWSIYFGEESTDESLRDEFEAWFRAFYGADFNRSRIIKDAMRFWLEVNQWVERSRYDPPRDYEARYRWLMGQTRQALIDTESREFADGSDSPDR